MSRRQDRNRRRSPEIRLADLQRAFEASATPGIVSGYVFGSRAAGRAHRESDVDVGILFDRAVQPTPGARFEARLALDAELARAAGGAALDLVVLNDAPPHLVRAIMTEGRQIFCADCAADHAARRTALSRAADLEPFLRRARLVKLRAIAR